MRILALSILFCPIFRESHGKFFLGSKISFCSTPQATMVHTMTEGIVNRFLRSAKAEMLQKNETEIRCPSKMQAEEPYCGPGFRAGAGPPALAWFREWLSVAR